MMSTADRKVRTSPGKGGGAPGASGVAAGGWYRPRSAGNRAGNDAGNGGPGG
ncbi:hypothetical protein GCM10010336_29950 [Streptomyces goshikiensis]|nr:hypothetical protein GCM10010336_29950 [Streptomyces goshikiensis]